MTIQSKFRTRLQALLEAGETLRHGDGGGYAREPATTQLCSGWLTSVQNLVQLIAPDFASAYRFKVDRLAIVQRSTSINHTVGELVEVLKSLLEDVDAGLLTNIVDRAQAEVFDQFLDHAAEYLRLGRKQESGAIAGVVFEDTLRRICRRLNIPEAGVKLDQLISVLASKDVFTSVKAKRARAAADLRTRATHAQWDEYELQDVEATIQTTRELIDAHLDGASHP